ncbi:MAG: lysophospholipid acyltransferase family protein [Bacteroidota bacterium]
MYYFLRLVVRIALRIFFRKYKVYQRHLLATPTPLLIVANHPNTFMDPLIIASLLRQKVYFLANGSIFKGRLLKWLWRQFNMIPIYRIEDTKEGIDQATQNKKAFEQCFLALKKGATILIFPEGVSEIDRKLRKIKTGTARIALGAAHEYDFTLGLQILPIGLNYEAPQRFRSDVWVNVGEPIDLSEWRHYQPSDFALVRELTATIDDTLRQLVVDTTDEKEDQLVRQVTTLYKNEFFRETKKASEEKEEAFRLIKHIIAAIRLYREDYTTKYEQIRLKLSSYFTQLTQHKIPDHLLRDTQTVQQLFWRSLTILVGLTVSFPLYLYGLFNNYLPYILPSRIANLITREEAYRAPIMLVSGIFSFSIFYSLQISLFARWVLTVHFIIAYALSLPISGFFVLYYWRYLEQLQVYMRLWRVASQSFPLLNNWLQQRQALLLLLQEAENRYWQKIENSQPEG